MRNYSEISNPQSTFIMLLTREKNHDIHTVVDAGFIIHHSAFIIMINLTPHAIENLIEVSPEVYERLVKKTEHGWSQCQSREEMLAKLHYLREGFQQGKIDEAAFLEREQRLVLNWWNRGS